MHPRTRQLATSKGLCPNCGDEVARLKTRVAGRTSDVFDCPSCGRFEYGSKGPNLPLVVPVR